MGTSSCFGRGNLLGVLLQMTCWTSVLRLASVHTSEASELIMVGFTAMVGLE
jgi:hypothetical protein